MIRSSTHAIALAALILATGCPDEDDGPPVNDVTRQQVVENYAEIVHLSYVDARDRAVVMQAAIERFLDDPTAAKHEYAKRAWLEARIPYGQTEAYRFYDGPIDVEGGPEGQLNAWPLDEAYIDYVDGNATSGIVNDPSVEITKAKLASLNEGAEGDITGIGGGFEAEKAVSTGYHAIEFLLWGQDAEAGGPGSRPYTDFVTGAGGTASNADRRAAYLRTATELLVDDLDSMVAAWAPGEDNFRAEFVAGDPDEALRRMLTAIGILAKGELAAERMDVALQSLSQEDEHSCFSDNTHNDILMNATGVQNVYLGRYAEHDGPGIDDLVRQVDGALDAEMQGLLETSIQAIKAFGAPFDQAIAQTGSASWNQVNTAVSALFDVGDQVVVVGTALGLGNISVELPE